MKNKQENDFIEIFAGSIFQVEMLKSLLENSDINAFLKDEMIGTIAPWQSAAGGAGSVRVFVSKSDYPEAKIVVEKYIDNLSD